MQNDEINETERHDAEPDQYTLQLISRWIRKHTFIFIFSILTDLKKYPKCFLAGLESFQFYQSSCNCLFRCEVIKKTWQCASEKERGAVFVSAAPSVKCIQWQPGNVGGGWSVPRK